MAASVIVEHPELYADTELAGASDAEVGELRALIGRAAAGDEQARADLSGYLQGNPELGSSVLEAAEYTPIILR